MSDMMDNLAMRQFRQVSIEETTRCVTNTLSKSCELDPIPTDLLKDVINELAPILTDLINTSLQQGIFQGNSKKLFFNHYSKSNTDQKELQTNL